MTVKDIIAAWASTRRWMQRCALRSTPGLATLVEQQRSRRPGAAVSTGSPA